MIRSARTPLLVLVLLLCLGCDPGQGGAASPVTPPPSAGASPAASAGAGAASSGAEVKGVYDYSQVVSLDDPDGGPKVLTFAVTTERKLKGVEASLVSEGGAKALSALGLDFNNQSLVVVVRPGGGPPPEIVSVERSEKGAVVKFRVPPAGGEPSKSGQGRFVARVVSPPIPGSATFEDLTGK